MIGSVWLGEGPEARRVKAWIERAAGRNSTVLLTGETGTGKGLVARRLHAQSSWASGPFIHVDLACLAPTLLESELFGHERGAFTGAESRHVGRFEAAAGGTLFLDEIGELPLVGQARLLRVLQDRKFERLGGQRSLALDARVVAATNIDLQAAVRDGRFREDLYYRLDVLRLHLPPLRERPEDLPILARAGLARAAQQAGVVLPTISDGFLDALGEIRWNGNVRELQHVLERALFWSGEQSLARHHLDLALSWSGAADTGEGQVPPRDDVLVEVLHATGGNVSRAARRLGIPRTSLRRRIRRAGLQHLIPKD